MFWVVWCLFTYCAWKKESRGLNREGELRKEREQVTKNAEPGGRQEGLSSEPWGRAGFRSEQNSSFLVTGGQWPKCRRLSSRL